MSDLTPAQIEEARTLYARGNTPHRVAVQMSYFGRGPVTAAQVRAVVELRGPKAIDPEIKAKARAMRLQGRTQREIADRLNIPLRMAKSCIEDIKLTEQQLAAIKTRLSDERREQSLGIRSGADFTAANEARKAQIAARKLVQFKLPEPVEVPTWVPDHLHEFYEHTAQVRGEEIAASLARQLKRGQSVAWL